MTAPTPQGRHIPRALDYAQCLRGRICDLPNYLLGDIAARAAEHGVYPWDVRRAQRQIRGTS